MADQPQTCYSWQESGVFLRYSSPLLKDQVSYLLLEDALKDHAREGCSGQEGIEGCNVLYEAQCLAKAVVKVSGS